MICCSGCSDSPHLISYNTSDSEPIIATGNTAGSLNWLSWMMDRYHTRFDVYTDANAAGNHFSMRGRMAPIFSESGVPPMNEQCTDTPHSGRTCIMATFIPLGNNWGGWYFMNGVLDNGTAPIENWGDIPDAGVDLTGATTLSFWARGQNGGERVKFFTGGIGWPSDSSAKKPYPDSLPQLSTDWVTLTPEWTKYTILLGEQNLSSVLGGFGWASSSIENNGNPVIFYLDDIRFDKSRLTEPRFVVSYQTIPSDEDFDEVLTNVGFTYDNVLVLFAYLARGEPDDIKRARILADALVYAQEHDPYYTDGRLRNAYQGGDIALPNGWYSNGKAGTVRMPGWYNLSLKKWTEDVYQISSDTGNMAWAMLGLLGVYEATGDKKYLSSAEQLGAWIDEHCADERGTGGFKAGVIGWEGSTTPLLYKSTEHNLDLYAAYSRLVKITGKERWNQDAERARIFVLSMWDDEEGKFYTGTRTDGVTINRDVIPLDCQTWTVLSLRDVLTEDQKNRALLYAENHMRVGDGYSFAYSNEKNLTTCVWFEGTGQMALACRETGLSERSDEIIRFLENSVENGGLYATDEPKLYTGFDTAVGDPWYYYYRKHIGATAWKVLTEEGVNPFWME
ncbi:MAG: hypothetical protein JXA44_08635 [Methanospirillaceae archaeon]|nr:hypothetical protein [Methanospirillaceae archaeon]